MSLTEEERSKIYGRSGKENGNFGNRWNDEQKINMRQKMKMFFETHESYRTGKTNTELFGEEISSKISMILSEVASARTGEKNPFYGKHHTEKTKETLRAINKGKKPVNTKKIKIGDSILLRG